MRFKLALLSQIHHPGHPGQGKRAIGHHRNRRVKLQPRAVWGENRVRRVDGGKQRDGLNQKNERFREHPKEGEPVSRPDQKIEEDNRPTQKHEHFKEVRQRAMSHRPAPFREKRRLEQESQPHHGQIEPAGTIMPQL